MNSTKRHLKASLLALIVSITTTFAQTAEQKQRISSKYNQTELSKLSQRFKQKEDQQKAKINDLAAVKGWRLSETNPDGSYDELIAVSADGTPLYYTIFNVDAASELPPPNPA